MANTKFEAWLENVDKERKEHWDNNYSYKPYTPLKFEKGRKYIRIWDETSCWGFVSMVDGFHKGVPIKKGDLLKPEGWKSPAKHSRGNIFDGTDQWEYFGPTYLK